jgi:hypothetical protein
VADRIRELARVRSLSEMRARLAGEVEALRR